MQVIVMRQHLKANWIYKALCPTLLCWLLFAVASNATELSIAPLPQQISLKAGKLLLTGKSSICIKEITLQPLAEVLSQEIYLAYGLRMPVKALPAAASDIVLELTEKTPSDDYVLDIDATANVSAGNYQALAQGTTTLLQVLSFDAGELTLPKLKITDHPATEFRSVMLDLARRFHPVETLQDTIELLRLAKIRYLHLHLSDNESCTFTSAAFPKLATPQRSYTLEQWHALVKYADDRGVTIIPEIDMPGHAGSWVSRVPEVFGTKDPVTGKFKSTGIVNMASDQAYEGIDTLVGELCQVFQSSPYIHLGADEVSADGLKALPEYLPYCEAHRLKEAAAGKAHELLCHFVVRADEIVRKHGRKSIVWSGFPHRGTANVKIPRDLLIMAWDAQPKDFLAAGFPVINCCWVPLYLVPPQSRAPTAEMIFDWNIRKFDNWDWNQPLQLAESDPIRGAQICFWEQRYNEVIPLLLDRVFAFSERTWSKSSDASYAEFEKRQQQAIRLATKILRPVTINVTGLIENDPCNFKGELQVTLQSSLPETVIRYTLESAWEKFPTAESSVYAEPISLRETMTVSARLFSSDGQPLGGITQQRFSKIEPIYAYRVFSPIPRHGWKEMPNFAELQPFRTGVTGRLTKDRAQQINRSMFAGVREVGHIDVRVSGLDNPFALELKGRLKIEAPGEYEFKIESRDGKSQLRIGDQVLQANLKTTQRLELKPGEHPFTIEHFYRAHTNDLNIMVKAPAAEEFVPFEKLVLPLVN
jgi:hexosaminidase